MPPKKGGSGADREKKAQNKAKAEKVKQVRVVAGCHAWAPH
jgi:hypothetical protein